MELKLLIKFDKSPDLKIWAITCMVGNMYHKVFHQVQGFTLLCLNIGTPKTINFPFWTNGKLIVVGVPIFEHFRVLYLFCYEMGFSLS